MYSAIVLQGIVIGLVLGLLVILCTYAGMNVKRGKRRGGEVLHYEDMTPEQKKEYGIIPMKDLSPDWQAFYKGKSSKIR